MFQLYSLQHNRFLLPAVGFIVVLRSCGLQQQTSSAFCRLQRVLFWIQDLIKVYIIIIIVIFYLAVAVIYVPEDRLPLLSDVTFVAAIVKSYIETCSSNTGTICQQCLMAGVFTDPYSSTFVNYIHVQPYSFLGCTGPKNIHF